MESNIDYAMGSPEAWDPNERQYLAHRFLPISQFTDISGKDKIFLCGRRGTGKSAIALMLEKNDRYKSKVAIHGEIEEYGSYMDIVRAVCKVRDSGNSEDVDVKHSIRRLWLWALPVKVMQLVVQQPPADPRFQVDIDCIRSYLAALPSPMHADSSIGHLLTNAFQIALRELNESGVQTYNRAPLETRAILGGRVDK